jgi:CheY-like chemotaxis protein
MKILIVDDDADVVMALVALFGKEPEHELITATTGGQGLQAAMALGSVDLLITDVVMEPMDGFKLRTMIQTRYPAARVIFVSGYDLSEHGAQLAGAQLLAKPVDREELFAAITREFPEVTFATQEAAAPEFPQEQAPNGAVAPVHPPEAEYSNGEDPGLIGQTIGSYQLLSRLGDSRWGQVYAAVQTSINRPVGLKLLDGTRASDEGTKARFLGDARAKANVQHPAILAVYEAGEAGGHIFYTHEYVDGRNMAEVHASGERLTEPSALKILKVVAEGLNYLHTNRIAHAPPKPTSVYLSADGHPRLSNLATQVANEQVPVEQEIQLFGRTLLSVLPAIQSLSPGLRTLLSRMVQAGPQAVNSWGGVIQGVKALEPRNVPIEAARISAQDRAAIAAVEAARKAQKRSLYINIGSMLTLVLVAAVVVWKFVLSNERTLDKQIAIPAGEFIFGAGQPATTGAFWIDQYEVTIGQYAKFVQALEGRPTTEFDHERQPRIKAAEMHKPKDWATYIGLAKAGRPIHGVPSDLNMPAIMVDWWDAYAYAKWKGRELPSEKEWEKAARGTRGLLYPWGDDLDPRRVNSGADFNARVPSAPAKVDGFNFWGPVDKMKKDKTEFGVFGMAGNVAEWTATWTPDNRFPIIKGGNFMSADVRLDRRTDNLNAESVSEAIGFRTISRTAPLK